MNTEATDRRNSLIRVSDTQTADGIVDQIEANLKVSQFATPAEWFSYYGNPNETPSWFTYLKQEIERSQTKGQATGVARANRKRLDAAQAAEIERMEVEKGIEEFYASRLGLLEQGLQLAAKGRQYSTPIGRIDLLCQAKDGDYVVVEIKANEAGDAVFGQILRYIGWVHRNMGQSGVRGIILASGFPETARYSRIGLLKQDAEQFIQFKQHGLYATNT